ncbi:VanZ like protein [Bacillus oleivorans]|uniref:VanZ like protein n=1 Tax=Bacillus oleivorans TaxID=1448271 RepID=A0A285CS34_9BACI|nr:VanZ family protein [Bacillus oleivorans]SNX69773.1 VanZ like protein [Bacillus oleivorans]
MKRKKMKTSIKIAAWMLFVIYLVFLTIGILFKFRLNLFDYSVLLNIDTQQVLWKIKGSNFIPFKTIIDYLFISDLSSNIRYDNLIGNVVAFIPLGIFLPTLSKKLYSAKKIVFAGLTVSLFYELIQLIFAIGQFDVDDIILNTVGAYLGYLIFRVGVISVSKLNIHFFG